jgi:prophage regulatory protein
MTTSTNFNAVTTTDRSMPTVMNPPAQLIPLPEVLERLGISRPTLYRYVAAGTFPKPIKIGPMSRWLQSEVEDWIAERIAERSA